MWEPQATIHKPELCKRRPICVFADCVVNTFKMYGILWRLRLAYECKSTSWAPLHPLFAHSMHSGACSSFVTHFLVCVT